MALLYSRPRIKLPKLFIYSKRNKGRNSKTYKVNQMIIISLIIILIIMSVVKAITPVFNRLCVDKAKSIATIICNNKTNECMKKYKYSDFIIVHTDKKDNVKMLEANMININLVISEITEEIQKEINTRQKEKIYISSGSFTGINLLSGRGPRIPVKIATIGNINTDFKSEFIEKNVNQTLHRLYLEIECEISILTPFNTISEKIINQLIVAENIIVGEVPQTFYNLEGMSSDDVMEVMQ